LHKLTTYLAKNHGKIVIEDLNMSGMLANRKLANAVQDMSFYEFRRQLDYKTQLSESELIIEEGNRERATGNGSISTMQ
jgi:putative transposase